MRIGLRLVRLSVFGPILAGTIACGAHSSKSDATSGEPGDGGATGQSASTNAAGSTAPTSANATSRASQSGSSSSRTTGASDGGAASSSTSGGARSDGGGAPGSGAGSDAGGAIAEAGLSESGTTTFDAAASTCPAPTGATPSITVNVNAATAIRTIPDDLYGYNAEVWNGYENGSNNLYNGILANAGFKVMRWMGGSWGDSSAWNDLACIGSWVVTYQQSSALYKQLGIRFQPIVNGSSDHNWCNADHAESDAIALATSWVQDGALGAKYWEVGNELYGEWEQGSTTGSNYGSYFADYYKAMKAINTNIQVLAVGLPQDTTCGDCQPGDTSWTSDLLKAAYAKGVVPDGFQIHMYPGDDNDTILHADIEAIGTFTSFLDTTVSQIAGGHGPLAYAMTEFGVSGNDPNGASRFSEWINAEFTLQYVLEMAKNRWAASNTFGQLWTGNNFTASPTFYVYAFLNGKFGRDLVTTSSSSSDVRGYASIDASGRLTIFLANNATTANTVRVNVLGYDASCSGQIWVMQGANGGGQGATDIDINGTVHPSESSAQSMAGVTLATGGAFNVQLPASSLALVSVSN